MTTAVDGLELKSRDSKHAGTPAGEKKTGKKKEEKDGQME